MDKVKQNIIQQQQLDKFNIEKSVIGTEAYYINQDIQKGMSQDEIIEKARSGVYKLTAENKKAGRVGQKYGESKKEDESFKYSNTHHISVHGDTGDISISEKKTGNEYGPFKTMKEVNDKIKNNTLDSKESTEKKEEPEEDDDLQEGFSERQFEDFVNKNKSNIRNNMETYDFKKKDLPKVSNYYDVANILGCDSRAVKNIDHDYYMRYLKELL